VAAEVTVEHVKRTIYFLAPHEPRLDPRVDWTARFLPSTFRGVVYGIRDVSRPLPAMEEQSGYKIVRLPPAWGGLSEAAQLLAWYIRPPRPARTRVLLRAVDAIMDVLGFVLLATLRIFDGIMSLALRLRHRTLDLTRRSARVMRRRFSPRSRHDPMPPGHAADTAGQNAVTRFLQYVRHFIAVTFALVSGVRQASPPSVLHCHDLNSLLAGVILKRRYGCHLTYDAHEFWPHADVTWTPWEIRIFERYEKALLAHVDRAFTVSPMLAEEMRARYGKDFLVVPNCAPMADARLPIDPAQPLPEEVAAVISRQGADTGERPLLVLFHGNFATQRGIEELISAWSKIDPRHALLLLRGPANASRTKCEALASELGLRGRSVIFLAPVDESELVSASQFADVGVIPYKPVSLCYRYCSPNKLSQYMQAGLAILSNHLDFVEHIVRSQECGLTYDTETPSTIVTAVEALATDRKHLQEFRSNALQFSITSFNWESYGSQIYDSFEALSGGAS